MLMLFGSICYLEELLQSQTTRLPSVWRGVTGSISYSEVLQKSHTVRLPSVLRRVKGSRCYLEALLQSIRHKSFAMQWLYFPWNIFISHYATINKISIIYLIKMLHNITCILNFLGFSYIFDLFTYLKNDGHKYCDHLYNIEVIIF